MLPVRLGMMLEDGLRFAGEDGERLRGVALTISGATWERCQRLRPPEDTGREHEWVVFANFMRIASGEGLSYEEKRVGTAFAFTHDLHGIARVIPGRILRLEREADAIESSDPERAVRLRAEAAGLKERRRAQRIEHMERGAEEAESLLRQLKVLTGEEVARCKGIVSRHDGWKIGRVELIEKDRLAVACVEADALWPLHPLGVLTDLLRPDEGRKTKDFNSAAVWRAQLEESRENILNYRKEWRGAMGEAGVEKKAVFQTGEANRMYEEWCGLWGLSDR